MHSHVVEFLSAVFARFNVTFYLEYHCTAVSEVSRGKKWSVNPFQTLKVQDTEYTYSSANFRNYDKKNKIGLFHKICRRLFYVDVPKWTSVKLDIFPCLALDRKSPPCVHCDNHFFIFISFPQFIYDLFHISLTLKEESSLIFSAKKLICIGKKFVPQTACLSSEVNK